MTPRDAAVARYKARGAFLYQLWAVGTPDPDERERLALAICILGRAKEAEMFGDPSTHSTALFERGIPVWQSEMFGR
jgi:hypothetical protein